MLSLQLADSVGKAHLSYSSIKYALQDMRLWEMYMKGQLKMKSDALTFGSMYDCLLFTPEDFDKQFMVVKDKEICKQIGGRAPRMTNKYKDWIKSHKTIADEKGLELIGEDDYKKAHEMIERLQTTGVYQDFLCGDYQFEFNKEINGVPVRGFLDCKGTDYISDSKTAQSIDKFRYNVFSFGYDIQAYIYCEVLGIKDFYWVVQEKSYPFPVAVYKASDETLAKGQDKFNLAVERISYYLDNKKPTDSFFIKGVI